MKRHLTTLLAALAVGIGTWAQTQAFTQQWTADNGDGTFTNPILNADFPDPDIIRVGDTYYLCTTTMFYFPGATILKSKDLVNWQYCANPLKKIGNSDAFNLENGLNHYSKGQWAPTFRYHDGTFYLYFIAYNHAQLADAGNFVLTTTAPEGEWTMTRIEDHYYDSGLMFDTDGSKYIAYGNNEIRVSQLRDDFTALRTEVVIKREDSGLEGSHMYHIGDYYYIYATYGGSSDRSAQTIFRSKSPFGPYEEHPTKLMEKQGIHQGGLVETQTGEWWTILFKDAGAIGRVPYLEPVTWKDGWPTLGNKGIDVSKGGAKYRKPNVGKEHERTYLPTNDAFCHAELGLQWEWNHNPDMAQWSLLERPGHLRLYTASVCNELWDARNMLTQRIIGLSPEGTTDIAYKDSYGTARFDLSGMKEGDICGLAVFQDPYAYVGVKMINGKKCRVFYRSEYDEWGTIRAKIETVGNEVTDNEIYLRTKVNFGTNKAQFYTSTDNKNWIREGQEWTMRYTLKVFVGNRFGLFNYATKSLGGHVDVDWFSTETDFSEEKYYTAEELNQIDDDDLTATDLLCNTTQTTLLLGDRFAPELKAIFRSGREDDVTARCTFEVNRPGVVSISKGILTAKSEGQVTITAHYADPKGNELSEAFDITVSAFPLVRGMLNPTIWGDGTFDPSTLQLQTGQWGFAGWKYPSGADMSQYRYIVVRLAEKAKCLPSFRLIDDSNYWTSHCTTNFDNRTELVIDLRKLTKEDGTRCDPSHIFYAGFWTHGGSPITIKELFFSNDGTNPAKAPRATTHISASEVVSTRYFNLAGQEVAKPQCGLTIERVTTRDGRVISTKVLK